jgi:adhesin HecA-like repeat protein
MTSISKLVFVSLAVIALALSVSVQGQIVLSGTSYQQTFDSIGSGLPTGWNVATGATASANGVLITGFPKLNLGQAATDQTSNQWSTGTGVFHNYAAMTNASTGIGLPTTTPYATPGGLTQTGTVNRALGLTPTSAMEPGGAFIATIANTTGLNAFSLNFDLTDFGTFLVGSRRTNTWSIDYRIGGAGAYTAVGTFQTSALLFPNPSLAGTNLTFSFGAALDNQSGTVEIRVVQLTASTGSGNRDSLAIDNWTLNYSVIPEPSTIALIGMGLAGLVAFARRRRE